MATVDLVNFHYACMRFSHQCILQSMGKLDVNSIDHLRHVCMTYILSSNEVFLAH